jgi:hypothetical protein
MELRIENRRGWRHSSVEEHLSSLHDSSLNSSTEKKKMAVVGGLGE